MRPAPIRPARGAWGESQQMVPWIRNVLEDPALEVYRRVMPNSQIRRIALESTAHYAVIIQIDSSSPLQARFITAYVVDSASALASMRTNPKW